MATHLSGKNGNVYTSPQLLEDCEDAWDVGGTRKADSAAVSTDRKVGDSSVKMVCTDVGITTGELIATEDLATGIDLETPAYTHLMYWAKCTDTFTAAGDMQIGVSHTADLGAGVTYSDIPKLTADTWKYCISTIDVSGLTAVDSIGAKLTNNDPGAFDLYLDDIRIGKAIAGIRAWTLDYIFDALDTTDFVSGGVRAFIPGPSVWSGTFEGVKDGAPISIGTQVGLLLAESATIATQAWSGNAVITAVHPAVSYDTLVVYSYDYQGVGDLTVATT